MMHVYKLALPHDKQIPAEFRQFTARPTIAENSSLAFRAPEDVVIHGGAPATPTGMGMPKTPVDEDNLAKSGKYQIRRPGQVPPVQSESVAKAMA